eukprot:gene18864-24649_t
MNSSFSDKLVVESNSSGRDTNEIENTLSKKISALVAFIGSVITIFLITAYCSGTNADESYLGGLNWGDLIFNYHPIFMTTGMIFCFVNALLSFKYLPLPKIVRKSIHGVLHTLSLMFVIMGLTAVIVGNNFTNYNTVGIYFANLFSLHSFVGLSALAVYFQNYLIGFLAYGLGVFSEDFKEKYLSNHVLFGLFALFLALAAVESGIMELFTEYGCGYEVTSADINPAANYHLMTEGCRLLNAIGMIVLVTVLAAVYAILTIRPSKPSVSVVFSDGVRPSQL